MINRSIQLGNYLNVFMNDILSLNLLWQDHVLSFWQFDDMSDGKMGLIMTLWTHQTTNLLMCMNNKKKRHTRYTNVPSNLSENGRWDEFYTHIQPKTVQLSRKNEHEYDESEHDPTPKVKSITYTSHTHGMETTWTCSTDLNDWNARDMKHM